MAIAFNDVPPDQAPLNLIAVVPEVCPYEISTSGAVVRRPAGSTRPAPNPCPVPLVRQGDTSEYNRTDNKRPVAQKGEQDLAKVADHRQRVLLPICRTAGVPAAYLDACQQYLQTRGGTIDQFMALLQQDPNAVAALQAEAAAFMTAAMAERSKGSAWPWLLGGLVVAGGAIAAVVVIKRRRARGGGGTLRGPLGRPSDLVREYNAIAANPSRYTRGQIQQLATRLDVASAAPGHERLGDKAERLRELL